MKENSWAVVSERLKCWLNRKYRREVQELTRQCVLPELGDFSLVELTKTVEAAAGKRMDVVTISRTLDAMVQSGDVVWDSRLNRIPAYEHPFRGYVPENSMIGRVYKLKPF